MVQQEKGKLTLKDILEKHNITLWEVYEKCNVVTMREIEVFYENNIGFRPILEHILHTVNGLKHEKGDDTEEYTLDAVSLRYIYG